MRAPAGRVTCRHHVATQNGLHVVSIALEWHIGELDARALRKFLHRHVRTSANAGMAIGDLFGVGFGEVYKILDRFERRICGHNQAKGVARQAGNPGKVFERIELHFLHVRNAKHPLRQLRQRVAIWLGVDQFIRTEHAASTWLVVHDNGLSQCFAGTFSQRAHHHIGGTTRRPRADVADGARREGLRVSKLRQR